MIVKELLTHDNARVKELAELLANIGEALQEKTITEQEYVSLMVDAERLRKVIALAEDLSLNIKINEAIRGIIDIAKMVKF
jgi:mannitol/fructose-specific phosphotransferase system IIA component